ncbi:MAG: indolepyruvate ferredoxin oxidoreductase subunit alpha [Planctomycetia bacterium]|nr:indolepyruvate ferredoxin oxidoreductase subunit alpha [Planctomycetia bacterium]
MQKLLSGNEAFARGMYESGVKLVVGYPGTPSTEILENVAKYYKESVYCEWAPNEKVALETAIGTAMTGARAAVTMKHVGLNVAADPLMSLAYTGTPGGLVIIVADDPGMHSSQNEQDTRHFARFAKIPILEPSDSSQACQMLKKAFLISEEYGTPVIVRTVTRVSHSRSLVKLSEPVIPEREIAFQKNPQQFVLIPAWARQLRVKLEERLQKIQSDSETRWEIHQVEYRSKKLGIITEGIAYEYVREIFPGASVLKLGCPFPLPENLIRNFASEVEKILVVEELEDFTQQQIRALGIPCEGKMFVPKIGELTSDVLRQTRIKMHEAGWSCAEDAEDDEHPAPQLHLKGCKAENGDIPSRPPVLCAGCPHRGAFWALKKLNCDVTGDIGCYSLGASPPLTCMDTTICMGASIPMAHGMQKSGQKRKVVAVIGDSTFFHSGITGLMHMAWNHGSATVMVLDNRITAMTGHQDNPGSGQTLMGVPSDAISIFDLGKACGIKNIARFNPLNQKEAQDVLKTAVDSEEAWLVISEAPCVLAQKRRHGNVRKIDPEKCKKCRACLKLGCPALEATAGIPSVNSIVCNGCGLCNQECKFGAISEIEGTISY